MRSFRRRWGDNDHYFGPLTFALDGHSRLGLMLDTGSRDDEESDASLRLHIAGCTMILALPSVLPLGRQYGAHWFGDAIHVHYGPQTFDSDTTRSAVWGIPWLRWRHVRHSIYGLRGEHIRTKQDGEPWSEWFEAERACPSVTFEFIDFDGERIEAKTHIEEREWHIGTGAFRWLSLIHRPRIHRSLDIDFSAETGRRKGSWKGGTVGHSIEMRPGELHEAAFRRYCAEHEMQFVGVLANRAGKTS